MPDADNLRGVAKETREPYLVILDAALFDSGYTDHVVDNADDLEVRMRRAVDADPAVLDDLWFTVNRLKAERAAAGAGGSDQSEVRAAADLIARMLRGFDGDDGDNSGEQSS